MDTFDYSAKQTKSSIDHQGGMDNTSSHQKQSSSNTNTNELTSTKKESLPLQKKYSITQETSKELAAKYGKIFIPSAAKRQIKTKEPENKLSTAIVNPEKVILTKPGYISPKEVKAAKDMFVENMRDLIQCRKNTFQKATDETNQTETLYSAKECRSDLSSEKFIVETIDPFTYNIKLPTDNQTTNILDLSVRKETENQDVINVDFLNNINDTSERKIQNKRKRKARGSAKINKNKYYQTERGNERLNCDTNFPYKYPATHMQPPTVYPSEPPIFPHNNNLYHSAEYYPGYPKRHPFQSPSYFTHPNFNGPPPVYFEYPRVNSFQAKPPTFERVINPLNYGFNPYYGGNLFHPRYPMWPHSCGYQSADFRRPVYSQDHGTFPPPLPWGGIPPYPIERHPHYPQIPGRTYYEL